MGLFQEPFQALVYNQRFRLITNSGSVMYAYSCIFYEVVIYFKPVVISICVVYQKYSTAVYLSVQPFVGGYDAVLGEVFFSFF